MKKIYLFLTALFAFGLTSCLNELDNYDAPNGGISGRILDSQTGEPIPLPVQGSGGAIVRMYELNTNASQSVDFYAKMDGSYENTKVFNCDYRIVVDNAPFVQTCEGNVTVKGQTTYDLTATPYARIQATASVSNRIVTINYSVTPSNGSYSVSEVYGYWNFSAGLDNSATNQAGKKTVSEPSGVITFDMNSESNFTSNLYKIKANNNKIYLRVGAKTEGKINYSTIIEVTVL